MNSQSWQCWEWPLWPGCWGGEEGKGGGQRALEDEGGVHVWGGLGLRGVLGTRTRTACLQARLRKHSALGPSGVGKPARQHRVAVSIVHDALRAQEGGGGRRL